MILSLLAALTIVPVVAQDVSGNVIIDSSFGTGGVNFNPVTSSSATEQQIMNQLYPGLLGVDPVTGIITPGAEGGLAESWDISEDGTTYTFHLREGFTWTDGTPVTANDFAITWDAIIDPAVETPLVFLTDSISDVVAIDDYTLEITFTSNSCEALNDAGFQPLPGHMYADGNFAVLNEQNYDTPEALEVGPYQLASNIPDQQTALIPAEQDFPDGNAQNDGYIMRIVGDQTIEFETFLAGETDVLEFAVPDRRGDLRAAADAGDVNIFSFSPGNVWDYIGYNLANPDNPQEAYDENGNLIEQDPHFLFGDVRVRQALSMALDVDSIIQGAVFGEGSRMQANYAPGTWVYDETVPFYPYDPEAAAALLEEAGWVDDDGDPSTPRVAQGALYAEDGTPASITLYTNQGNTRRNAIGQITQDQWGAVGIEVEFQTIDFNVLLELIDKQTFDAYIIGWQNGYPFRADQTQLFSTTGDTFGGSNAGSYINPEIDTLFEQAVTVPGCDTEARKAIYSQIQHILHEDAPYVFLYSVDGLYAWQPEVANVDPYPANIYYNIQDWTKAP
jgi:peptide/nickel transport system substrate-binding protein